MMQPSSGKSWVLAFILNAKWHAPHSQTPFTGAQPHGNRSPRSQRHSSRTMLPGTLQNLLRNEASTWPPNSLDPNLIEYPWDILEQVRSIQCPLWFGLVSESSRYGQRTSRDVLLCLAQGRGWQSPTPRLQSGASLEQTFFGTPHWCLIGLGSREFGPLSGGTATPAGQCSVAHCKTSSGMTPETESSRRRLCLQIP